MNVEVPPIFYGVAAEFGKTHMTEQRWTKVLALLDHVGRFYWDLSGVPSMDDISERIAIDAMTEAVADAISDSVAGLEDVARRLGLAVPPTSHPPTVPEAVAAYVADGIRRTLVDAELVAAFDLAEMARVSEPAPIIPDPIPAEEVDAEGFTQRERQQRLLDALRDAQAAEDERRAAEASETGPPEPAGADVAAPVAAPAPQAELGPDEPGASESPVELQPDAEPVEGRLVEPSLDSETAIACQWCGRTFVGPRRMQGRAGHERACSERPRDGRSPVSGQMKRAHDAQEAERAAIREVAQRSLTTGMDDALAAAAEFAAKRNAAAKRKADEAWAERHPGEVRA